MLKFLEFLRQDIRQKGGLEEGEEALPLGSDRPFLKPSQIIKELCTLNLKYLSLIFLLVFISFAYWEAHAHRTHL